MNWRLKNRSHDCNEDIYLRYASNMNGLGHGECSEKGS